MPNSSWIEVPIDQEVEGVPTEGYAPFYFPPSGDETLFSFTDESFTRVLSALINGAALTYPDTWLQTVWDVLVNVEYPVSICERMIDCITNDADTRAALTNWLETDPNALAVIQNIVSTGSSGGAGVGVSAADDAALFGACTFLIDTLYDSIIDFNQQTELGTNLRERAIIILQAIPVLGDAIAAIPEYIDALFENVIELFDGQWTTTPITGSRDRLRCGLFCLAKANGRVLSWELIETYFWDLVGFESTTLNIALDFVGFLVTGSWAGQDIVNVSFANMATAMKLGSKFGTQIFPNLQVIMTLGLNNPDSDYSTLCADCPDVTYLTPIINSLWDAPHAAGVLTGPDEAGVYTVTTQYRSLTNDNAFVLMAAGDAQFILIDVVYSYAPSCQVFSNAGTPFYISCPGTDEYAGETMDEFWSTFSAGIGEQTMSFRMIAP